MSEMESEQVVEKLADLNGRVKATEKAVTNYIGFMAEQREANGEVRDFIVESRERSKNEKEFRELRDKETKDELAKHYAATAQTTADLSLQVSRRNLIVSIAATIAAFAGVAVTVAAIIVSVWVAHHAGLNPFLAIPQEGHAGQVQEAQRTPPPQLADDSDYRPYQKKSGDK